jgi:HlyD family secretion protein
VKKIRNIVLVAVLIGTFIYTLIYLYGKSKPIVIEYNTEKPIVTNIIKKTVATGTIVPRKEVLIKSNVSGIVQKIFVQAGAHINKGDIIAQVKIVPDIINVNEAESRIERAKIALDNATQELERNTKLFSNEAIAKTELIASELNFKNTKQELETAENNLQIIKDGVSKKIGAATNTIIRSTISGLILDIPVKEGNSVIQSNNFNEGTTIASIADMGQLVFEGKVDESEVGKIRPGMNLLLTVGAIENALFNAKLEYIAPKGSLENGTIQFQIKAAIELNKNYFLRANYSANADIVLERKDSVLAISESVLQFDEQEKTFVELLQKNKIYQKKYIKTGLSDGVNIEILEGIAPTDIIKGTEKTIEKTE